jgi:hypothetical protein
MKTEDMFGTNGIYSNTFGDGSAWERPCSVEYLRRDSQPGFQVNCGIRIQGGLSRDPAETPKHKLRLLFKPFLNYDLYDGSPVTEFATLSLNAIFNDHWRGGLHNATFLKDQWCADTQDEMHGFGKHGTYVQVYINGLFWGFFDIGERPDGSYGAHYFGGIKAEYDAFSGPDELTDGDWDDFNQMMAIATAGITNATSYSNLSYYLDVPVFIDYLLINFYAGNQDWPENNWRAVSAVARDVPLHFFSWDAEIIFFDLNWNSTFISAGYIGQLYTALLQYPEFRLTFADHAQSLLLNGGLLSPERCTERWQRRAQEIDLAVISESARWGDFGTTQYTKLHWLQAQAPLLTNYFPHRTDILLSQLRARSLYPALEPPTFDPHGGIIPGYLPVTMTAPFGAIYYTTNGTDPRLPDGNVSPDALQYTGGLTLTNGVRLSARTFATNTWSAVVVADYLPLAELNLGFDSIERRHDGSVELRLTGFPGDTYNLQASANLLDWESIAMITPFADGTYTYLDVAAAALPLRFYRLTWP